MDIASNIWTVTEVIRWRWWQEWPRSCCSAHCGKERQKICLLIHDFRSNLLSQYSIYESSLASGLAFESILFWDGVIAQSDQNALDDVDM